MCGSDDVWEHMMHGGAEKNIDTDTVNCGSRVKQVEETNGNMFII